MSIPALTDRQRARMDEIEADLREHYNLVGNLRLHFEDETRPGRGHLVYWTIGDGERLAEGSLDPYGNGDYGVADVDWIHNGSDDECPCAPCVAYRGEDES